MQVCTNGIVSFDTAYSTPFPTASVQTRGVHNRTILAPFYADIDNIGKDSIHYRYIDVLKLSNNIDRKDVVTVEQMITLYSNAETFEAQSVLIATWHSVRPYQSYFNQSKVY